MKIDELLIKNIENSLMAETAKTDGYWIAALKNILLKTDSKIKYEAFATQYAMRWCDKYLRNANFFIILAKISGYSLLPIETILPELLQMIKDPNSKQIRK